MADILYARPNCLASPPSTKAPKRTSSVRCDAHYHMFTPKGDAPFICGNCGRNFCSEHAGAPLEEGIMEDQALCDICAKAYSKEGTEGLKHAKELAFRLHGS